MAFLAALGGAAGPAAGAGAAGAAAPVAAGGGAALPGLAGSGFAAGAAPAFSSLISQAAPEAAGQSSLLSELEKFGQASETRKRTPGVAQPESQQLSPLQLFNNQAQSPQIQSLGQTPNFLRFLQSLGNQAGGL